MPSENSWEARKQRAQERIDQTLTLDEQGVSPEEIALAIGVEVRTVHRALRQAGRSRGRGRPRKVPVTDGGEEKRHEHVDLSCTG